MVPVGLCPATPAGHALRPELHAQESMRRAHVQMVDLSADERTRILQQTLHARKSDLKRARSAADVATRAASDAAAEAKRAQGALAEAQAAAEAAESRAGRA